MSIFATTERFLRWDPNRPKDKRKLLLLIVTGKERSPKCKLSNKTAKAPHIDGSPIFGSNDHLRSSVEPRLDVAEVSLVQKHARSEVNYLDPHFPLLLHQNVLRLDVRVHHIQVLEESEGEKNLNSESTHILRVQGPEVVALEQLIEVCPKQLSDDANMSSKNYEILNPQNILSVLYILLLNAHQDVDLVERQMHLLPARPHHLHCHVLSRLVVESSHHLPERPPPQPFKQLVPVSHLFVLSPDVPSLEVIFAHSCPDANIVDCFFIDQFNPLML